MCVYIHAYAIQARSQLKAVLRCMTQNDSSVRTRYVVYVYTHMHVMSAQSHFNAWCTIPLSASVSSYLVSYICPYAHTHSVSLAPLHTHTHTCTYTHTHMYLHTHTQSHFIALLRCTIPLSASVSWYIVSCASTTERGFSASLSVLKLVK